MSQEMAHFKPFHFASTSALCRHHEDKSQIAIKKIHPLFSRRNDAPLPFDYAVGYATKI